MVKTHKLFNASILTCPLEEDMDIIVVPINPCEREDYDKEELFKKANQFYEDWFVNEKDDELLAQDKYTFAVLDRILRGQCDLIRSNHQNVILCHSEKPGRTTA